MDDNELAKIAKNGKADYLDGIQNVDAKVGHQHQEERFTG